MKRVLAAIALAVALVAPAFYAISQTNPLPGQIGDITFKTLTVQETSTLTGVVTAPAGVVGAVTGNVTGNVTGDVTGNVAGGLTPSTTGITPASVSPRLLATGGVPAIASTSGNDSAPSITETYVTEIFIPYNMTVTGVALFNGSDVTGNVTVGLATAAGNPITGAKSASTAGSGPDAYQRIPFAVAYAAKGPQRFYLQVQYSSATARYNTHTVGNFGCLVQTGQTYGTLATFTAPTTFVTNVCNMASLY